MKQVRCAECLGSGNVPNGAARLLADCPECRGSGWVGYVQLAGLPAGSTFEAFHGGTFTLVRKSDAHIAIVKDAAGNETQFRCRAAVKPTTNHRDK